MNEPRTRGLSISARLTLWYALTLVLLLSLYALFSYLVFRARVDQDFDRHLAHELHQLLPYVRIVDARPSFASLSELRSVAYTTDGVNGTYVRLLSPEGDVLYRSPNFERHTLLPVQLPEADVEATVSRAWEGQDLRSLYAPLGGDSGALSGWLEVSGFEWTMRRDLRWLAQALAAGVVLSVLLAVGGGYMLVRRTLSPVAALTTAANEIRATDLSTRLPVPGGARDELTGLAETFNGMLGRLEASFERERRFTSNAAHELLTPLATLRNEVEIALRRKREPADYQAALRRMLVDLEEMSTMVRDLLQLSHTDRLSESEREPVDLGEVARQHVDRLRPRAEARGLELSLDAPPGALIAASAPRIGEVLDNLLDNAIKYTPEGGRVSVRVEARAETVELVVEDTGVGFEPERAGDLFDRFYRADTPEVQAQIGSGLGLPIARAIVEAYGGTIRACSRGLTQGSSFAVTIPRLARS